LPGAQVTSARRIVPVPAGQPFEGGGGAVPEITAVGTEVASVPPSAFVAVTVTRRVVPTSTFLSTNVPAVAPLILEQLPPSWSQRLQA
jgi:hypothetical protein